jgi:hypothetical protein
MKITTDGLNYQEMGQLVEFIKDLKKTDFNVCIASNKDSSAFEIEFKDN